ncbi:transglutaminase [Paenibacillus psychroresistens]|uniref:Transglutaminase n=1 Tax=Paenibacillus psychroresistens TaxID=1778678 RepID=A0A6B8RIK5_9BACL|nr:transglutaminase domain-containing protein [Paenibacillus psychroresistens]QGQ95899.1 transglutaminase [Paenibacillus psychroresistens]
MIHRRMTLLILIFSLLMPTQGFAATTTTDNSVLSKTLVAHLLNQDRSFSITIANKAQLKQLDTLIKAAIKVNDYTHYIIGGYSYSAKETKSSGIKATFTITYLENKTQTAYVTTQVKQILKDIIKPTMDDFQKERAIHDYIVSHIAYDTNLVNYSAYAALTKGKTVCQGFALLTYRMLDEVGIKNRIVEGHAGGRSHAWNLVFIGGSWYQLDTTFDDPVPFEKGRIIDTYFNLTDAELGKDHTWVRGNYPAATTIYKDKTKVAAKTDKAIKAETKAEVISTVQGLKTKIEAAMSRKDPKLTLLYKLASRNLVKDLQSAAVNKKELGVRTIEYSAQRDKDGITTLVLYFKYA